MSSALNRLLTDFSSDGRADRAIVAGTDICGTEDPHGLQATGDLLSGLDVAIGGESSYAIARSAYQAGIEKGRRESESLLEAVRAEHAETLRQAIEAERQKLMAETLQPFANELSQALALVGQSIEKGVAGVLAPLLHDQLQQQALNGLKDCMAELLQGRSDCVVSISAPEEIVEELALSLAALDGVANITPTSRSDIEVRVNDTILNVQLGQLRQMMQEIIN